MTPRETREAVRRMLSKDWLTVRQVAARTGRSTAWARALILRLGAVRRPSTELDMGPQVEWHLPASVLESPTQPEEPR